VLRQGLERFPDERDLKMQLAGILSDSGNLAGGVELAHSLLNGGPEDRQVHLGLTQMYERHKRWAEAESELAEAEKLTEGGDGAEYIHFLRGALYERQKKFERAEAEFRRVIEINPESALALNYLGYMFADQNTKLEEAVELIERALKLDPYNGAYLDSLGWAYFRLGKLELAEEYLLRALQRLSRDPTIHDHLGDVYFKTGRYALAEKAWERAREEWQRMPPTEVDAELMARLEEKLKDLKHRLAQKSPPSAKPQE
jgi:tetratricopeptide (TPR) repeat protein